MSTSPSAVNGGGAGFTESAMVKKLDQVNNTMQSIQTMAMWLMHHRKHSQKIAQIWLKELKREKRSQKLLALIYLANDVIQNSRKKWPLYQEHFYPTLAQAFSHVSKYGDDKTLLAIRKVIKVWKDRNVYSAKLVEGVIYAITSNLTAKQLSLWTEDLASTPPRGDSSASPSPTSSPSSLTSPTSADAQRRQRRRRSSPPSSPPLAVSTPAKRSRTVSVTGSVATSSAIKEEEKVTAPATGYLLEALKRLQTPASADASTREKIAAFPESVANPSLLKGIKDAQQAEELHRLIKTAEPVVSDYCKTLGSEMEHRRQTQQMLIDYVAGQKQKAEALQEILAQFRNQCDKLKADRIEIYKHYESLPDLSKLPNQTQLAPLPTVGDLFQTI